MLCVSHVESRYEIGTTQLEIHLAPTLMHSAPLTPQMDVVIHGRCRRSRDAHVAPVSIKLNIAYLLSFTRVLRPTQFVLILWYTFQTIKIVI
jgi:hypothetical protein